MRLLENKARFITEINSGHLKIQNKKKEEVVAELKQAGYLTLSELTSPGSPNAPLNYDYLLSMALWSLTQERVEQLAKQLEAKRTELQTLEGMSIEQIWQVDLDAIKSKFSEEMKAVEEQQKTTSLPVKKASKTPQKKPVQKAVQAKKKQADVEMSDDSSSEWSSSESDFDEPVKKKAP